MAVDTYVLSQKNFGCSKTIHTARAVAIMQPERLALPRTIPADLGRHADSLSNIADGRVPRQLSGNKFRSPAATGGGVAETGAAAVRWAHWTI